MYKILGIILIAPIILLLLYLPGYLGSRDKGSLLPKNLSEKVLGNRAEGVSVVKIAKENYQAGENIEVSIVGVSEDQSEEYKVEIENIDAEKLEARVEETYENGEAKFDIIPPSGAKPGKYTLKVLDKNGNVISEQDFTWGVLAINTNKSIYSPDEKADIHIGVLDQNGFMVCNANVTLDIQGSNGQKLSLSTKDGTIKVNPECKVKAYVEKPDYEASIVTGTAGNYQMTLTAVTKNGSYSITDSFQVSNAIPFDIERNTATRIFPSELYPVRIKIKANQDFSGKIVEAVPNEFEISKLDGTNSNYAEMSANGYDLPPDSKALVWNISLKAGEEITLGYRYDSPDASPYFFTLGPLELITSGGNMMFTESRRWQIAVDATEFPTRLGVRETEKNDSATSTTVFLPNGSNVVGYLVIIFGSAGIQGGHAYPGGWTEIQDTSTGDANAGASAAYRVITGSEGFDGTNDSISVTTSGAGTVFYAVTYSVWGDQGPLSAGATGNNATPDAPNLSVSGTYGVGKHEWLVFFAADTNQRTFGTPTNYSVLGDEWASPPFQDFTAGISAKLVVRQLEAGSENPAQTTLSAADGWAAFTVGVEAEFIPEPFAEIRGGTTFRGGTTIRDLTE